MVSFLMSGIVVVILASPVFVHFNRKIFLNVSEYISLRLSTKIVYDNIKITVTITLSR